MGSAGPGQAGATREARTFSLLLYSDLRVVKTGGQPLLKFILRYLSRHSLNFSPGQKEDRSGLGPRRRAGQRLLLRRVTGLT